MFWKCFGTTTHDAGSGTEHELRRAWAAWQEKRRPDVMVYFCDRPYAAQTPVEQRVLESRRELTGLDLGGH